MVARSSALRVGLVGSTEVLSHHISPTLLMGIRFALCPFRSPLLRASQLVSFPAPTKMLHFGAFPILTDRPCGQEVPFGDPRFNSSLRLPGAFRSLARPSSAPEPSHSPDSGANRRPTGLTGVQVACDCIIEGCTTEARKASPAISSFPDDPLARSSGAPMQLQA